MGEHGPVPIAWPLQDLFAPRSSEESHTRQVWNEALPTRRFVSSLLFIYLPVYLFVSVQTLGYLFYTLGWNTVLSYLDFCSNCSSFGHCELFCVGPCVLLIHSLSPPRFFEHFFAFCHYKMLQAHLVDLLGPKP